MNNLTLQNFKALVKSVKDLDINTEEGLNCAVDILFEKAIDEPNFSFLCANMCKQLELINVPIAGKPGQRINFKQILLTKCQKEFEQNRCNELHREDALKAIKSADPDKSKELQVEFEEEKRKMRYRQLGNIRFIGELFKLNMLIEPIVHEYIHKLLNQDDEDSLECLCELLKIIGKTLEDKGSKTGRGTRHLMDTYFNQMQKIVDRSLTSSRVRYMLEAVIDLKKGNWNRHLDSKEQSDSDFLLSVQCQAISLCEPSNLANPDITKDKELYRKFHDILNNLTLQNFEALVKQVKDLDIYTEEELNGIVDIVFEKAIGEPNFSFLCANMCKQLALIKVPLAGQPGHQINFRKILLTKCQKEFEQNRCNELHCEEKAIESADPDKRKELQMEFDEERKMRHHRQLGNIRFIGELFKLNMLIALIIHDLIEDFLKQRDEESLECLCELLKTAGKELEDKGSKGKETSHLMDQYFGQIQEIVDRHLTSSRVRYMLKYVTDVRRQENLKVKK